MNNKYCELPASKSISEFKVGNRVRVFQREETDGYVTDITDNFLFINPDGEFDKTVTILVHFKACRKLKAVELRKVKYCWVHRKAAINCLDKTFDMPCEVSFVQEILG